jgi:hypothetical protein
MSSTELALIAAAGYAAKPLVDVAANLLQSLLGKPCKVAGGLIADQIYGWQWVNRIHWANKVQAKLDRDGVPPVELPAGFLVPLLASVGNIENDTLQDMFAELTASALRSGSEPPPAFRRVLEELSPSEAMLLRDVAANGLQFEIPNIDADPCEITQESGQLLERCGLTGDSFLLTLEHLSVANILAPSVAEPTTNENGRVVITATFTAWGADFIKRCCPEVWRDDNEDGEPLFGWVHQQHTREMLNAIQRRKKT